MRGQRRDYDGWSESLRDPSWAFEQLLPFFRAHERHWAGESNVHGGNGEWHIEKQRLSWEILDAFADACERVGIPRVADFNNVSGSNAGVGHFEVSQQNGLRLDAGRAFLGQPLPNLTVRTHAPVDRVILEGNKVISVRLASGELVQGGQVILCSGAIGSPAILERSGIGARFFFFFFKKRKISVFFFLLHFFFLSVLYLRALASSVCLTCRKLERTCKIICNCDTSFGSKIAQRSTRSLEA